MLSNEAVARAFACRESAKAGHFFTNGNTIWSYGEHFPVARWVEGVVLFNSNGYSQTTSRHKSLVLFALSVGHNIFTVPHICERLPDNVSYYAGKALGFLESAANARSRKTEYLECAVTTLAEGRRYCEHFGFNPAPLTAIPEDAREAVLYACALKNNAGR